MPRTPSRPLAWLGLALAGALAACSPDQPTAPPSDATAPRATLASNTIIVTNTNDDGPGSLRRALVGAPSGTLIQFDPSIAGRTIVLSSMLSFEGGFLTIEGPALGMTISGDNVGGDPNAGILAVYYGDVTLRNLTLTKGRGQTGGAILSYGTLSIENSTIAGNAASVAGGGIYITDTGGPGTLRLVNSTVSSNSAPDGGGIYQAAIAGFANTSLINSTITYNGATSGGGLYAGGGTLSLQNSIVGGNVAAAYGTNCLKVYGSNVLLLLSGTNMSDDASCDDAGPAMLIADPMLGPLASNGGPTRTHALLFGSPAVNAATDCTVNDDQRYVARPAGVACDIGAFEFTSFNHVAVTIDPSATINNKTGVALVSGTVTCSAPTSLTLDVGLSQSQKVGKINVTVRAAGQPTVACTPTPTPWSAFLAPPNGAFQNGAATATAQPSGLSTSYLWEATTSVVKLFWSKG